MSTREAACCGKTYQDARTGLHIYEGPIFIMMDALCTAAVYSIVQYDDDMHTVRTNYVPGSTVLTRIL